MLNFVSAILYAVWIVAAIAYFYTSSYLAASIGSISVALYLLIVLIIVRIGTPPKVSKSALRAKLGPKVPVIGPFISSHAVGHIRISIGLPTLPGNPVTCELEGSTHRPEPLSVHPTHQNHLIFSFDFLNLNPGEKYIYRFRQNGDPVDLHGGLTATDCYFIGPGQFEEEDSFIMMSCHNPFETDKANGWERWPVLLETINKNPNIKFLLLGGDQVYNDDVETEAFSYIDNIAQVDKRFILQYQIFWEDLSYRKVLARIPSFAMWDDHDITDGWGGRPESYNISGSAFSVPWAKYFARAREAFSAYQANRNPKPILTTRKATEEYPFPPFTFFHDFGENRVYALDLRTDKMANKCRIMEHEHFEAVLASLESLPAKTKSIFVLTPVVPFRTSIEEDERITKWVRIMFWFSRIVTKSKTREYVVGHSWRFLAGISIILLACTPLNWLALPLSFVAGLLSLVLLIPPLIASIPELPHLGDDLSDGLTSKCNIDTFTKLLVALLKLKKKGLNVVILSGDIHLGGISEIVQDSDDQILVIPQIVSSPVSYKPMPSWIEGLTSTSTHMYISKLPGNVIYSRNVFYRSDRNFARIFPGKITGDQPAVYFYFEGNKLPLAMRVTFAPR